MTDSVKIWLRLVVAAVGVTVLALLSSSVGGDGSDDSGKMVAPTTIARCEPGVVMKGEGSPDWRKNSLDASPVGITKRPLRSMEEQNDGSLATKMPILIEGNDKVTIAAAAGMDGRVKLFYGNEARSFEDDRGFDRVRFHPCDDKDRTVWPGGIKVEGPGRVRLKITVADQEPFAVGLGMPTAAEPVAHISPS